MTVYRVPVLLSWNGAGSPGANVWHVRTDTDWLNTPSYLQNAVDAIHAFYNDLLTLDTMAYGLWAPSTQIKLGTVVDVESSEEASPTWTTLSQNAAANSAPPAVQVVVTWKTSLAARRGRGRTFLGPLNLDAIEGDGTPRSTVVAGIGTAAQNLLTASGGVNGWAVGVWGQQDMMSGSQVTPEQRRAAPHVLRDYVGYSIKDKFAVLRSRRD